MRFLATNNDNLTEKSEESGFSLNSLNLIRLNLWENISLYNFNNNYVCIYFVYLLSD